MVTMHRSNRGKLGIFKNIFAKKKFFFFFEKKFLKIPKMVGDRESTGVCRIRKLSQFREGKIDIFTKKKEFSGEYGVNNNGIQQDLIG